MLTPSQRADITQAEVWVEPHEAKAIIAGKGYNSDAFVANVEAHKAEVVIY